jgi:catalase
LQKDAPTKDFISDAFAHCKFIGYVAAAQPLLERAGIADSLDEGCIALADEDVGSFIARLGELRLWSREPGVDADA